MSQPPLRIGIDLGGTKIAGIALDADDATRVEERVATPRDDYERTLKRIRALVATLEQEAGETGTVGIGMPGAITSATGLVKNANSTCLNGRPFQADIERILKRPVRIENDANCLALSEALDGAGAGARVVWAVILGTGIGSGIVIDGRLIPGRDRIAGEWGHNPLPAPRDEERPGPDCYCGRRGCIETFLSGPGFAAGHRRRTGDDWRAEDIVLAMRMGDAPSLNSFAEYLDRLGRGLAQVVNILDPDVIVLGGGLSRVDEIVEGLPERIAPHVFTNAFATPIRRSQHGDASGVRGAARLWAKAEAHMP